MLQVIIMKGLPGSGKSNWAKQKIAENPNSYKRISKDDLRDMLDNGIHSNDAEKFILATRDALITMALHGGKHVIVDDTNLASKHEDRIRLLVKGLAEVKIQDFTQVPIETCISRDLTRSRSVGEAVIRRMYNQFLKPVIEPIKHIEGLPHAVICDLDGTLCLLNGRNPYDASTCENDLLNEAVSSILTGRFVILTSGRDDRYREQTERFLSVHNIDYLALHMRKTGDTRKDSIIKKEMFDEHIRGKFNIDFVLDDRNQVVELWRSLGLICLQVAEGDF